MRILISGCTTKLYVLVSLLILSVNVSAGEKLAPESIDGTKRVSAEELVNLVTNTPSMVVIDARKSSDRESAGWIEGSIGLPNYDTDAQSLAKHIATKETPVLFYCNGVKCGRSVDSARKAVSLGYKNIYWFRGGWEEWTAKGLPVSH